MTLLVAASLCVVRDGAPALADIDVRLASGEFVGILGPNGAGKSTLLRCLAGLERPTSGSCTLDLEAVTAMAPRRRALKIAYLPQLREAHWNVDVAYLAALGRFAYGAPDRLGTADLRAVDRALDIAGVADLKARPLQSLSGGEQARAHLARALAAEAPALLADEPIAALDPKHQMSIMTSLRSTADSGRLVAAALHDFNLASKFCTRIILLDRGRIVADGRPDAVLTEQRLSEVYAVAARRIEQDGVSFLSLSSR